MNPVDATNRGARESRYAVRKQRKILITSSILLVLAVGLGAGSFATFNAQTNNPGNVFGHGTIVLSNTKQGGTACLSTAGGNTNTNVNTGCDQLLNLTVKKPGDSGSANVTLKNVGSLPATSFKVYSPLCTNGDVVAETYHGTGTPCSVLQLTVQQWSDAAFTVPLTCLYGAATGNTCNYTDPTKTVGAFATAFPSSGAGLTIGSGLAAGASAYFTIGVQSSATADNTFQGRQASLDFDWFIAQ
jgi:hypothetical protein